jgi:NAD-dependent dihydropyrimidine dehydrogenase PreA subunit
MFMKITVDSKKCQASGQCIRVCPQGAISFRDGVAFINLDKCDLDGICIPACPHEAIYFVDEA